MRSRAGVAGALALAAVALSACGANSPDVACPLIGYVYTEPVQILVDPELLGSGSVEACFGEGCDVAPIELDRDGYWVLPQEDPYLSAGGIGIGPGAVVVVAVNRGGTTFEYTVEVPYVPLNEDPSCPGPVEFKPVIIT